MADQASDAAIETRLRDFLAAELRQAESDFPHLPLRKRDSRRGARLLAFATLVTCLVAAVVLLRPSSDLPRGRGGDPIGLDGIPLSIGGQPVLRGADLDTRVSSTKDPAPFLAGGYLVLHPSSCASASPATSDGCDEDWRLDDTPRGSPTHSVRVTTVNGAAFVRTSGAPTVFRVADVTTGRAAGRNQSAAIRIEAVAWRQPTKGPIPEEASPPQGGDINFALVPDFVSVWGGPTGETIVGYAPKGLLLNPAPVVGGSPGNPPPEVPVPVYGEDLTTLVGNMVPGHGFVPLGSSFMPSVLGEPSANASPSPEPSSPGPLASGGSCDLSTPTLYGTWWREIGGPHAFFHWDDGPRPAGPNPWLVQVRFDPDANTSETVSIWAERLETGERQAGYLNSRADPRSIYHFDSPAPVLPGGWYLFEQLLPSPGCWRLSAAIDDRVVGTAIVEVGPTAENVPERTAAPTPALAPAIDASPSKP